MNNPSVEKSNFDKSYFEKSYFEDPSLKIHVSPYPFPPESSAVYFLRCRCMNLRRCPEGYTRRHFNQNQTSTYYNLNNSRNSKRHNQEIQICKHPHIQSSKNQTIKHPKIPSSKKYKTKQTTRKHPRQPTDRPTDRRRRLPREAIAKPGSPNKPQGQQG